MNSIGLSLLANCAIVTLVHAATLNVIYSFEGGADGEYTDTDLVRSLSPGGRAIATFASKGHDLFASIHGTLRRDQDRAAIDRLWNRYAAAWYEGGKADPKLALLRLDPERAEIWLDGSSLMAGIKLLLGADPKKEYRDNVAEVSLR